MPGKKNPYRFTIGFAPGDPAHRQTVELLNQQGHRKAQFIVNAILHYVHCSETPDISEKNIGTQGMGEKDLEMLVIRILKEKGYFTEIPKAINLSAAAADSMETGCDKELNCADMAAIADTLAAFRSL